MLFQSILQILLELLVLTTSPHPFGSSFSKLRGHGNKLDTHPAIVLYSAWLYKGTKSKVSVGTGLIYQRCRDVIGSNVVAFIGGGAGDVQINLSAAEGTVNVEVTENLLCCVCNDGRGDEIPSRVTDPSRGETFSTIFFRHPSL